MKKFFGVVLAVMIVGAAIVVPTMNAQASIGFSGGDGSSDSPWQITTCQQLTLLHNHLSSHFVLDNDMNCPQVVSISSIDDVTPSSPPAFYGIGDHDNPFAGVFNGQGHTISNLTITGTNDYVGLFGDIDTTGIVENISVTNASIAGNEAIGVLAGYNEGTITNAHTSGTIVATRDDIGGLVGGNSGTISNSSADVDVTGTFYVAGFVGGVDGGSIDHSSATGNVNCSDGDSGGFVGYDNYPITDSSATGDVTCTGGESEIGGFAGSTGADVTRSYATGNVVADGDDVGGFVGYGGNGTISQSFATGNVTTTGDDVGGFAGFKIFTIITDTFARGNVVGANNVGGHTGMMGVQSVANSYSTGTVTGTTTVGGFLGEPDDGVTYNSFWDQQTSNTMNSGAEETPKTTVEMKTQSTFTDTVHSVGLGQAWDFDSIWTINQNNNGYPSFRWYTPLDDGDGISTAIENAGPNNGDANNDGTLDSAEENVASFPSTITGKYIVIEASNDCHMAAPSVETESTTTKDIGFDYPQGLVNFTLTNCASGSTVTLYFYDVNNAAFTLRKFTSADNSYFSILNATLVATSIAGHNVVKATYAITDNGTLDSNATVGTIVDPVGLGTLAIAAPQTGEGGTAR